MRPRRGPKPRIVVKWVGYARLPRRSEFDRVSPDGNLLVCEKRLNKGAVRRFVIPLFRVISVERIAAVFLGTRLPIIAADNDEEEDDEGMMPPEGGEESPRWWFEDDEEDDEYTIGRSYH